MQRRLSLATTLIHDPELIFLDEPTAGIDPVLRRKFWDHFRSLRDAGHTLFVTTQYVGEAAYCDYVGVMRNGELIMVETPDMLRYRALGGHIINIHTADSLSSQTMAHFEDHPLVKGEITLLDKLTIQFAVEDASTAIPQLLEWCSENEIEVESINEFVPPFDDVFVMIMNKYSQEEEVTG
jgi:ABC-2 type transport system ATP-binding protein